MKILGSIFGRVVNLLVGIGDFVILVALLPLRIVEGGYKKAKNIRPHKKLSGTFNLKKPKRKVIFKVNLKPVVPVVKAIKFILKPFVAIPVFIFLLIKSILLFPIKVSQAIRRRREAKKIAKQAKMRKQERMKNGYHKPGILYKLKYVLTGFILASIFVFIPLVSFIFVSDLPSLSDLSVNYIPKTTKIYDRNGNLLYEIFANQNRSIVRLQDIPKNLRSATVAIEDKDFYSHPGFDLRGMTRAFVSDISKKSFQGGSTITQQLIKSAFLTSQATIIRKVKEIALAFWAERIYSKNQILELYLNYVPYGGTAWGAAAASDIYFGEKVQDLDLAQSAFLAGLPQSPSVYSPFFGNGNLWKGRQKEVLDAMVKQNYISKTDEKNALAEELTFRDQQVPLKAPHFVFYIRNLLIQKYGISEVERGGLTVRTTLDLPTQEKAEQIVSDEIDSDAYLNVGNGAALITTPLSGDIVAMVGSRNYYDTEGDGNVNLTTSLRQPGSSIKLITYSLALSQGYTEATMLDDTPLTITSPDGGPSYTPVNYDGNFHGRIPLRTAFANSFNIPPVRITQKFGADAVKNFGLKMGIDSWQGIKNYGVSITLGAADVRMTDLATAYGDIANSGSRVNLDPILEIKDSNGLTVYKKQPIAIPVLDPGVAFIISDILADNNARQIEFGLNTPLHIEGARVSVKTGTTDNKRDNWTIGFTPSVLVATWVGNNDNSPMNQALASGVTGAAPMWNRLMSMMLQQTGTPSAAIIPGDIVKKYCVGMDRYFVRGTENSVSCGSAAPSASPSPTAQTP